MYGDLTRLSWPKSVFTVFSAIDGLISKIEKQTLTGTQKETLRYQRRLWKTPRGIITETLSGPRDSENLFRWDSSRGLPVGQGHFQKVPFLIKIVGQSTDCRAVVKIG